VRRGWSIVQRSLTDCGTSECDRESSAMKRPWPTGGGGCFFMISKEPLYGKLVELHLYVISCSGCRTGCTGRGE
jgi:hypothetical protein